MALSAEARCTGWTLANMDETSAFQERAARVSARRAKVPEPSQRRFAVYMENASYPLAILACFVIGVVTIVFLRWIRFQISGEIDPNAGLGVVDALLIGGMTMATREVMNFRQPAFTAANVLGLCLGMLTMHNFIHLLPELFARMFSEKWVDVMTYETAFPSLMFGATNIPLL